MAVCHPILDVSNNLENMAGLVIIYLDENRIMITRQAGIGNSVDIIRHFSDGFIRENAEKVARGANGPDQNVTIAKKKASRVYLVVLLCTSDKQPGSFSITNRQIYWNGAKENI
jgi:hypothetical protein